MNFISLRINRQFWAGAIQLHIALAHLADVFNSHQRALQTQFFFQPCVHCRLAYKGHSGGCGRPAQSPKHAPVMHGLWRGDGSVGIAHGRACNHAALEDDRWLNAEEGGLPKYKVRQLTHFHRANLMANSVSNGWVDGVFGDIRSEEHTSE